MCGKPFPDVFVCFPLHDCQYKAITQYCQDNIRLWLNIVNLFSDSLLTTIECGHPFTYTAQAGQGVGSGKDLVQMGQFPLNALR